MTRVTTVELQGVSHRYGRRSALTAVSLQLHSGVVGLLGPNGAGKSTLMKVLSTVLVPQTGSVTFDGLDITREPDQARALLGYLPQRFDVMGFSTVRHNVEYAAWAHGLDRSEAHDAANDILERVDLAGRARSLARSLSGGMRQRLGIACAMVHRPAVLLLDEPTVGLDPQQRFELRTMIAELGRDSIILISTHLVEDLTRSASQVVVMHAGRITYDGTIAGLEQLGSDPDAAYASSLEAGYHAVLASRRD